MVYNRSIKIKKPKGGERLDMKKFKIEKISTLRNNGQACEQDLRYYFTNKIERPDNKANAADIFDIQIKSARATLCKGTDLEGYVYNNEANRFAYVTAERMVYIMNKDEFYLFACEFATVTTDSAKNGGNKKMRLRYETPALLAWLESHATEKQAKLNLFDSDNNLLDSFCIEIFDNPTDEETAMLCKHYAEAKKNLMQDSYAKFKSDDRYIFDNDIEETYNNAHGYINFYSSKMSEGFLNKAEYLLKIERDFFERLSSENDRRAYFGNDMLCALVKETEKAFLIGIGCVGGVVYDWYPKKHATVESIYNFVARI